MIIVNVVLNSFEWKIGELNDKVWIEMCYF